MDAKKSVLGVPLKTAANGNLQHILVKKIGQFVVLAILKSLIP
jgi:hypothetical protein